MKIQNKIAKAVFLMGLVGVILFSGKEQAEASASIPMGDDITGTYSEDWKTLTVSGSGDMWSRTKDNGGYEILDSVKEIIIEDGITSIGDYDFYGDSCIREVAIPDSVVTIGEGAFGYTSIQNVTIGDSVEYIGDGAFYTTGIIDTVTLSPSIKEAGNWCGSYVRHLNIGMCSYSGIKGTVFNPGYLEDITVAADNPTYKVIDGVLLNKAETSLILYPGAAENNESYVVPETVTYIKPNAFCDTGLKQITLDAALTRIGSGAFYGSELEQITLNEGLVKLESNAFSSCKALESVGLPGSLQSLGKDVFAFCSKLRSLSIGECTAVNDLAKCFYQTNLDTITTAEDNPVLKANDNVLYLADGSTLILYPAADTRTAFKVPSTVTEIGAYAFAYSRNLKKVVCGQNLKNIDDHAFMDSAVETLKCNAGLKTIGNCAFIGAKLKSLTLGAGVVSIGDYAFACNYNLTDITYDSKLERIGDHAFGSTGLKKIEIPTTVKKFGDYVFEGTSAATLSVGTYEGNIGRIVGSNSKLSKVTVSSKNKAYVVKDNVVYNKAMTKLAFYPGGRKGSSYTVPKTVKYLGQYAVTGNRLKTLTFEGNLKSIGKMAVAHSGLDQIVLKSKTVMPTFDSSWNGPVQSEYISVDDGDVPSIKFNVQSKTMAKALKNNLKDAGNWNILYLIYVNNKFICRGTEGRIVLD